MIWNTKHVIIIVDLSLFCLATTSELAEPWQNNINPIKTPIGAFQPLTKKPSKLLLEGPKGMPSKHPFLGPCLQPSDRA